MGSARTAAVVGVAGWALGVWLVAPAGASAAAPPSHPAPRAEAPTCAGLPATIVGTARKDVLTGTSGDDVIAGGDGNDTIRGRGGDDVICGDGGSDRLDGGSGDDRLDGGANELIDDPISSLSSGDILRGGPGDDLLDVGADPRDAVTTIYEDVTYRSSASAVVVRLDTEGNAPGLVTGEGRDLVVKRPHLEVDGSLFDDFLIGSPGRDVLRGLAGDDTLLGLGGSDTLFAEGQSVGRQLDDDVVDGGAGNDYLYAFSGRDVLRGGAGRDDLVSVSKQPSTLLGGDGRDVLHAQLSRMSGYRVDGGGGRDAAIVREPIGRVTGSRRLIVVDTRDRSVTADFGGHSEGALGGIESLILTGNLAVDYYGTAVDETFAGDGRHRIRAWMAGGDDLVYGSRFDDVLDGGPGTDEARAGDGTDSCPRVEVTRSCP